MYEELRKLQKRVNILENKVYIEQPIRVNTLENKVYVDQPLRTTVVKRYIGKRHDCSKELLKLNNSLNQFSDVQIDLITEFLNGLEGE